MEKANTPVPSLRNYLIQGAFGALTLKLSQIFFSLLLSVILARLLGVEGFGTYAFCIAIVNLMMIPAMLGGESVLVREVATYRTRGDFSSLRGLLKWMRWTSLAIAILLALVGVLFALFFMRERQTRDVFFWAAWIVPLLTVMKLQNASLRGLRHVFMGQVSMTLLPVVLIIMIGIWAFEFEGKVGPEAAVISYAISAGAMVMLTGLLLWKYLPEEAKNVQPAYETQRWVKNMLPFLFIAFMQMLNQESSVVLLGVMQDAQSVGLYRVAQRCADLITFGLLAVNMAIAPAVAEIFDAGEKERLQQMINKSIIAITFFALPVTLFLILGGRWVLPFAFGRQYSLAYSPLVILCVGQVFNACMGSVGVVLNMIGLERLVVRGITIATLANVILTFAFIPWWGLVGAAVASSTSLFIWNVLLAVWLYRETGIVTFFRLGCVATVFRCS